MQRRGIVGERMGWTERPRADAGFLALRVCGVVLALLGFGLTIFAVWGAIESGGSVEDMPTVAMMWREGIAWWLVAGLGLLAMLIGAGVASLNTIATAAAIPLSGLLAWAMFSDAVQGNLAAIGFGVCALLTFSLSIAQLLRTSR